jgi:hypothetical protein
VILVGADEETGGKGVEIIRCGKGGGFFEPETVTKNAAGAAGITLEAVIYFVNSFKKTAEIVPILFHQLKLFFRSHAAQTVPARPVFGIRVYIRVVPIENRLNALFLKGGETAGGARGAARMEEQFHVPSILYLIFSDKWGRIY